ncbi:hypothetical protein LZ198_26005 [Myxococcus sp. K15C18031901]|uniref:hypothetical protein n=1 Tax=Myxococcus dinghuensis TaxID=2906761 RepID=UPI0020A74DFF|nr:hypothetical protein [Myxococcus dinghuensis]MCP3102330.1 hypothetical protein [Myxococcus dinghuensis]
MSGMAAPESGGTRDTEQWLCAGLGLTRQEGLDAEAVAKGVPWLLATLAESPSLPPPALLWDLGRLVAGQPLAHALPVPDTLPRLRAAVRAYDDHVLARLAADPHLEAVSAALARLPEELRPRGMAFLANRILARIGFTEGRSVNTGLARRTLERPPAELLQAGYVALREPGPGLERLAEAYEALARGARRAHALLGDAEAFTLENLEHLQGKAQRLALEQAVEAAEALSRALPPRMRARAVTSAPTPTALEDDAAFPQGGFSSVSNVGSLENLVTSELVYMEDEPTLDLFDVRYVEGELLYYTRDESVAVRRRRVVTFVLPAGFAEARVKDAGVRWQRAVVALGLVLCLVRRLSVWLGEEDLRFQVVFIWDRPGPGPLDAERGLCELLLREWRARGIAEVLTLPDLGTVLAQATESSRRARIDVVRIDAARESLSQTPAVDPRVSLRSLDLSAACPRVDAPREGPASPEESRVSERSSEPDAPWEAWTGVTLELARSLL